MPADDTLSLFEMPPAFVKPALEACRMFNTGLDRLFYDTPGLARALKARGETITTQSDERAPGAKGALNLGAQMDPEGSLLVIDPAEAPYVRAFHDVKTFLNCEDPVVKGTTIASITGVGSSALGSAALAWNISTAFGKPVLAIVPGYGVADVIYQGLGGWFGFGLYDALHTKSNLQTLLAAFAPKTAAIGRHLSATAPGSKTLSNGGPVFRTGCGSSDVLHDLVEARAYTCVVGHSKGALSIANALQSLDPSRSKGLRVVTLGCPIDQDLAGAHYHQFLGLYDALGALNAWGNRPDTWIPTDHSTNVSLPLSMHVRDLVTA